MKLFAETRNVAAMCIASAMWYMVCLLFIPEPWCAIFKVIPLAVLVAALATKLKETTDPFDRKTLILPIIALCLSMVGDVFGDTKLGAFHDVSFLLQIFFFMAAHFVYIGSFVRFGTAPRPEGLSKLDLAGRIAIATILVIALVALCDNMLPALESKFRLAVCAYMVITIMMAFPSLMQTRRHVWYVILGATLFVISDAIIAWTSFIPNNIPLSVEDTMVFLTYYGAQILLNIGLIKKH